MTAEIITLRDGIPMFSSVVEARAWFIRTGRARNPVAPPVDQTGHETVDTYMATIFAGLTRMSPVVAVLHLEADADACDATAEMAAARADPTSDWHRLQVAAALEQTLLARLLRKWSREFRQSMATAPTSQVQA